MRTPMKLLREHLKMSQTALAESLDRDHSLISLAEGGRPLGGETIRLLLDTYPQQIAELGLSAEDFLRGEVGEKPAVGPSQASEGVL
jgi:transcriptional regulator with XRE-family HTH domain